MLKTSAFNKVITRILLQLYLDGKWYSIALFLKTMVLAKYNYKIYNKETLAII